jgi:hypothetical protein
MLLTLYPRMHRRYTLLPVLGPILEGFGTWLAVLPPGQNDRGDGVEERDGTGPVQSIADPPAPSTRAGTMEDPPCSMSAGPIRARGFDVCRSSDG